MEELLVVRPIAPGLTRVRIAPMTADLAWARGLVPAPKGEIRVDWHDPQGGRFEIEVDLPPGVTDELALPGGGRRQLTAGKRQEL